MSDNKGVYVSDAIVYDSIKLGKLNGIFTNCGSGKTTAAFTTIPQHLKVAPSRSLVLIDTLAGQEDFVNEDLAYLYTTVKDDWDFNFVHPQDKPAVMTYHLFGAQVKKGNILLNDYDYIVCDELPSLNKYIGIERGKLNKQYPQAAPWEINDMLQMTCLTYIAVEAIYSAVNSDRIWVFTTTATPRNLYIGNLEKLGQCVSEVQFSQKLHAYEILSKFEYAEIEPILRELSADNPVKRLFYFNTIKELQKYKKILLECGRAAEALWSPQASTPMSRQQFETRDYILREHRLPENIQDLLINSAYETGITIKDEKVEQEYIHSGNEITRIQATERLRQDKKKVGYYNKDLHKANKKNAANQLQRETALKNYYLDNIPTHYFNCKLYAEDKEQLLKDIFFPKKWPTLKKALLTQNYKVEDGSNGAKRYSIITPTKESPKTV